MADDATFGARDLLGLGGLLLGCVVGWTVLGLLVDRWAGCAPVGVVCGVALGMASAAAGFAVRVRQAMHVDPGQHDPPERPE